MTAGGKTKLQVDSVISIHLHFNPFGNKRATCDRTNSPSFVAQKTASPSFVAQKTAMIFNSPFEYDVIETFVRVHKELVYSMCSQTRSSRLWDLFIYLFIYYNLMAYLQEKEEEKKKKIAIRIICKRVA